MLRVLEQHILVMLQVWQAPILTLETAFPYKYVEIDLEIILKVTESTYSRRTRQISCQIQNTGTYR